MPIVMTNEEWERIKLWADENREDADVARRRDYLKFLDDTSREMTKNWPNSLEVKNTISIWNYDTENAYLFACALYFSYSTSENTHRYIWVYAEAVPRSLPTSTFIYVPIYNPAFTF